MASRPIYRSRRSQPPTPAPSTGTRDSGARKCGDAAAECAASACALCVCCPLMLLWCFIKAPAVLAWRAGRRLLEPCCGRCGLRRRRKMYMAASSSFSDIEFESSDQHWGAPAAKIPRN